ncbi:MAG: DAK2 domain-containing protein [Acidimicrobiales bacterium]
MDVLGPSELRAVVTGYRDALRAHQARLNKLNVYPVPDGDTGTNMALTVESVVAELAGAPDDMPGVCKAISHGSLMGARGNSGVILCQVLRGLTDRIKTEEAVDGVVLAEALAGASAASYQAVMKPVEGTILTVVRESADAAQAAAKEPEATLLAVLEAARDAGCDSLARTPELLRVLKEAGVVDAGGAGFLLLIDVLLHAVDGRPVPESGDDGIVVQPAPVAGTGAEPEPQTDLRYEVMFLLEGAADEAVEAFKAAWAQIGDSIVVVGGDGVWNCHIHTDDAGAAVEAALDAGRPRQICITDLAEQIEHERCAREEQHTGTAVVAVGAGEGAVAILRSLGVDVIVAGGQSMNPSTAELLDAIEATTAAEVVLLPNNRNVVPVAEHAVELATRPVALVPTESMAEGFAALIGFDAAATADANAAAMADAAESVRWGEVTWAVRDATTPAGPVKEGDHIGLIGHDIVVINPDLVDTCCRLLEQLVNGEHELVTVVEGQAASAEATQRIEAWLNRQRPGVAVEVHRGDQPLSAYLFSAE